MRFDGCPFPNVGLRGTSDPATCEDCHSDQQHQPRLVSRPLGGPAGPRWDGGPAKGLIKLEVRGVWTMPTLSAYAESRMALT